MVSDSKKSWDSMKIPLTWSSKKCFHWYNAQRLSLKPVQILPQAITQYSKYVLLVLHDLFILLSFLVWLYAFRLSRTTFVVVLMYHSVHAPKCYPQPAHPYSPHDHTITSQQHHQHQLPVHRTLVIYYMQWTHQQFRDATKQQTKKTITDCHWIYLHPQWFWQAMALFNTAYNWMYNG